MQDGTDVLPLALAEQAAGIPGRQGDNLDLTPLGLLVHLGHYGQAAVRARTDDELVSSPGDFLFDG